ncbi:hypothetical protein ACMT1E_05815 [Sphingomonas flavalba]|uniref:hypothetical protein n=1 Tax=Sphingomonas flavalba TaxID=2559804 RepID=UPI0039E18A48
MSKFRFSALAAAAAMLVTSPVLAAGTSASRLSVSNARVAAPSAQTSEAGGGNVIALALAAGIAAIVVLAAINNDKDDKPASA